jgi:hypothetical protein
MSKIGKRVENIIEKAVSGAMGKELILRNVGDDGVLSEKPTIDKNRVLSPKQVDHLDKFAAAVDFGNAVMSNPDLKETYEVKATKSKSAFRVAVTDYLKAPKVTAIDAAGYTGAVGSTILVKAKDDFDVKQVRVTIYNPAGDMVESGLAILDPIYRVRWIYTATQVVAILPGSKIKAESEDVPGNKGELIITL